MEYLLGQWHGEEISSSDRKIYVMANFAKKAGGSYVADISFRESNHRGYLPYFGSFEFKQDKWNLIGSLEKLEEFSNELPSRIEIKIFNSTDDNKRIEIEFAADYLDESIQQFNGRLTSKSYSEEISAS